ncbi:MAG: hypothetical protein IJT32_06170, partial [Lachnospiraceae bacterium]|nr:hypothetical protein [Lachnospiraceae bacterium]
MKDFFRKNYILLIITVLSAVGFCVLSYLTVLQFSVQSVEQLIETSNSGIIKEVETSLSYGKKLSNYYGISQVLSKAQELLPEESILTITDADGGVIATTEGTEHFTVSLSEYGVVEQTICEETGEKAGVLTTYYRKQPVRAQLKPVVLSSVVGSIIILLAVVLITAFIHTKRPLSGGGVAAVFTAAILLQGALLTVTYGGAFEDVARKSVTSVADYVTSSVNHVLDKGVHISEIADLDSFFAEVVRDNNVIEDIQLTGKGSVSEDEYTIVDEITDLSARKVIVYYISEENIRSLVIQMVLTFVATSFLSVIVMRESLTLSEMLSFRRSEDFNTQTDEQFDVIAKAIRYGNFLSLTFDYLCLSFSALLIKEWNEGFLFMSPVMAAALSISICQIADLLGMIAMPSIGRHIKGQYLMAVSA